MENEKPNLISYTDEELAALKQQKSRNRIFGIVLGAIIVFSIILLFEIIWLFTH